MIRQTLVCGALLAAAIPTMADSGPYIEASIGNATLNDSFDLVDVDDDSAAYRVGVGMDFGGFGIEAGYHRFGTFAEDVPNRFELDADGFYLGGNLGGDVAPNIRVFGRGGVFFYDGDSIFDEFIREARDDGYFYFGGGAEVSVGGGLSLVGDWTRYQLEQTESDVISIGFRLRF